VSLKKYIADCELRDGVLLQKVENLIQSQEAIVIWGAGTLTRRLLAATRLRDANIVAFVDSNPRLRGRRMAGRTIISPDQLTARSETIVVCSKAFEREIVKTIRDQLALSNRVILIG
jgi:FlaA1/EpsC-like NDP-sugar epimerase